MRILLVRHAHAGVRGAWPGHDLERELSDRGRAQADEIARQWSDSGVGLVLSSRAVRCTQTVRPLADRLGLAVAERPQLLEGTVPTEAVAWLESLDDGGHLVVVACSHGDVIGGVVERLLDRGTDLDGGRRWPKASTWELEVDDGLVTCGRLHLPPDA